MNVTERADRGNLMDRIEAAEMVELTDVELDGVVGGMSSAQPKRKPPMQLLPYRPPYRSPYQRGRLG